MRREYCCDDSAAPAGRRRLLAGLGAALALPSGSVLAQASGEATTSSQRLPDRDAPPIGTRIQLPRARLIDGTIREPGYWQGKVVVLELWATWCPFCRKQNPVLDQLHREHSARGLEVLGLSIDRTEDEIRKYYAETGYRFPSTRFDRSWWEAIGKPRGLPIVWVIGRDGRLAQVEIGEMFAEDIQDLARWLSA
jgi:thiol-disulfide isomerase/thioredoxin